MICRLLMMVVDLPYWVDVPAEKDKSDPKGMLMLPYT